MCVLLPAWLCLLLGLLPVEIQTRAVSLQRTPRHRLSVSRTSKYLKSSYAAILPRPSDLPVVVDDKLTPEHPPVLWRALLHKDSWPQSSDPLRDRRYDTSPSGQRGSRGRRHVNGGGARSHGHLMRVGCVLGTCQVQNLSHRLYQLIGQSGREDSSPINPRSPHSYG